ncbi:MAG: branched-chain amino acid ABC transporter permease [Thermoleophilia bacterium]|nr:branched-chain amino acid ABC transporter permease [Thermoleophilia bacterium]
MNVVGQLLFDGLVMGLVYVILAVGLVLITSVNKILFMAYGMFYTIGAYFTWFFIDKLSVPYAASAIIGALVSAFIGMLSYLLIFQRLQQSKGAFLATLIGSLGLMLVLNQGVLLGFGTVPRSIDPVLKGSWKLVGVTVTPSKLLVIVAGVIITSVMFVIVMKTKAGRAMRTASFQPEIASLHGISANRVYMLTLALATGTAGLAGALLAPNYGITADMGNNVIWTVLLMMMVGGMDSLFGAVAGGLVIGEMLSFGLYYLGGVTQIIIFAVIGIILYIKPAGLLGRGVDIGI